VTRIAVIDHGAGNLVSISQGLRVAGADVVVAATPDQMDGVDGIILPGVGATGSVMDGLRSGGFIEVLQSPPVPLLGICVGMQVLFESSTEDGARCLGIIEGRVEELTGAPRLPHIGWNDVALTHPDPLFTGMGPGPVCYFVHGFAAVPADPAVVRATTDYGDRFVSAVRSGPVAGVQFHPERSGSVGIRLLANFVASCRPPVRLPEVV